MGEELGRIPISLGHKSQQWIKLASSTRIGSHLEEYDERIRAGYVSYAVGQALAWHLLAEEASATHQRINPQRPVRRKAQVVADDVEMVFGGVGEPASDVEMAASQ